MMTVMVFGVGGCLGGLLLSAWVPLTMTGQWKAERHRVIRLALAFLVVAAAVLSVLCMMGVSVAWALGIVAVLLCGIWSTFWACAAASCDAPHESRGGA